MSDVPKIKHSILERVEFSCLETSLTYVTGVLVSKGFKIVSARIHKSVAYVEAEKINYVAFLSYEGWLHNES